jgi:histidinol phosphatase-like PHP family hydrolase
MSHSSAKVRELDNGDIAELLSKEAENAAYPLSKALRRASRAAFMWPDEAATLLKEERLLTELHGVGPRLAGLIRGWIDNPVMPIEPPTIRRGFLTLVQARQLLGSNGPCTVGNLSEDSREILTGADAARCPANRQAGSLTCGGRGDHESWLSELKGDLQMHTEWSDGSATIRQMSDAGAERGYEYIAITDHSQGLKIAGGINESELLDQRAEIEEVNESLAADNLKIRVLRSIELNLNPRGEGDMEPASLDQLDLVLGSFHSALRRTDDQTARYIAALQNPNVQILGHPQGRIYGYRLGLHADWPSVFAIAAELDKAVEIDAYPDRQDLNVSLLGLAKKEGCRISVGTDAHHPWQLEFIDLGLAAARLAGLKREAIVNYMSWPELQEWVARVRDRFLSTSKH